jgi:putative colanic acid biosynthesis UDP-glucose lipid carrier transferase
MQLMHGLVYEPRYVQAGIWAVMIFLVIGGAKHLYGSWRVLPLREAVSATLFTWCLTAGILVFMAFLGNSSGDYSRGVVLIWFALSSILLAVVRVCLRQVLKGLRSIGRNTRTLAVAGKTKLGQQIIAKVQKAPWLGMEFVGYFDDRQEVRDCKHTANDIQVDGDFADLVALARAGHVDYIYITLPMRAEDRIVDLVNELSDTTVSVYLVPNFFVFDLLHGKMTSLDGIPVLSLHESPFYGVDGWVKHLEDMLVASLILLIIAIPMVFIALGVKLTSPGPILFKQRRYGLNGAVVEVWKFRSMTVCEDGDKVLQAQKGDMRITRFGAFLRKTSLDELPQFFNVLQGQMSVVGPRPHAVSHNEEYRKLIRGYMLRHKVKPGITGWAQVSGWRGETETLDKMEMRVKYDLEYMQCWSLWLDIKIIFMTIFKGFNSKNAY